MNESTARRTGISPRVLHGFLAAALALGVIALGYGLLLVGWDLSSHEDEWDGIGVVFGLIIGVPGLLVTVLAATALRNARRRPATTRSIGVALGVLIGVSLFFLPIANPLVSVPAFVLAAGLVVAAPLSRKER